MILLKSLNSCNLLESPDILWLALGYLLALQEKWCKTGDMVIISQLQASEKTAQDVSHKVQELVFKLGDIKDPISGEMVVGPDYRGEMEQVARLYGNREDNFNYKVTNNMKCRIDVSVSVS